MEESACSSPDIRKEKKKREVDRDVKTREMRNRVVAFSRLDALPEYGPITLSEVVDRSIGRSEPSDTVSTFLFRSSRVPGSAGLEPIPLSLSSRRRSIRAMLLLGSLRPGYVGCRRILQETRQR